MFVSLLIYLRYEDKNQFIEHSTGKKYSQSEGWAEISEWDLSICVKN